MRVCEPKATISTMFRKYGEHKRNINCNTLHYKARTLTRGKPEQWRALGCLLSQENRLSEA
jgi:hypothetical protein